MNNKFSDVSTTEIHTSNDFTMYNVAEHGEAKRKLRNLQMVYQTLLLLVMSYIT